MKYYSEKTHEFYDSEEKLRAAEKDIDEDTDDINLSLDFGDYKKKLQELKDARAELKAAEAKASELSKKYLEEVNNILRDPTNKVNQCKHDLQKYYIYLTDKFFFIDPFIDYFAD